MKLTDMIRLGVKGFKPAEIKQLNGSGIETDEIIKLAENGYSLADINELITLSGDEEKVQPGNEGDEQEAHGPEQNAGHEGDKQDDYIEKINSQEKEIAELKKTLQEVQNKNASSNLGPADPKDPRKELQEIFKSIY